MCCKFRKLQNSTRPLPSSRHTYQRQTILVYFRSCFFLSNLIYRFKQTLKRSSNFIFLARLFNKTKAPTMDKVRGNVNGFSFATSPFLCKSNFFRLDRLPLFCILMGLRELRYKLHLPTFFLFLLSNFTLLSFYFL